MKKIFAFLFIASSLIACKKDDGGGGGTTGTSGPQISDSAFISHYTPGSKLDSYIDTVGVTLPTSGTNLLFDYSNLVARLPLKDSFLTPNNTANFPTATYMQGFTRSFLGQSASLNSYYSVNSQAWSYLGDYFNAPINFTLPQGSLNVPTQATKQNPAVTYVNFPVKYNDTIAQTCTSTVVGTATVSALGQSGAILATTTTTVGSKNIAWGTLKLKGYTDSMQCVVQKYTVGIKTDVTSSNVIINGLIPTILGQLQVPVGQTIYSTEYRFWAATKGLVMTITTSQSGAVAKVTTGL